MGNYKVVVIGAGPGGVILARELALKGIDVSIYEKGSFEELGHDWSDAVEVAALKKAGLDMPKLEGLEWQGSLVKQKPDDGGIFEKHAVPLLKIFSPGLVSSKEVPFRMITTDRRRLGQLLVEEAVNAGARIFYRHEGRSLLFSETGNKGPDGVMVEGVIVLNSESGQEETVRANVIVESSGFHSILRKGLPAYTGLADSFRDGDFALVHREVRPFVPEKGDGEAIVDHYRYGYHSGYQWTHMHSEERIDVGAGVKNDPANPDPRDIIEEFISRHPAIKSEKIRGGRSLCIVGAPLPNFVTNGFLVLGDAASTSVPTTGCGAGPAIVNGLSAAEVIAEAARENRNDIATLWAINTRFYLDSYRGPSYAALAALRTALQAMEHDDLDFLFKKDLIDAATLQNAVNGVFKPPGSGKMLRSLFAGLAAPGKLMQLNKAVSGARRIFKHYQQYPDKWDHEAFRKWQAGI
jgi:flavin-dependent dehydrogenase